MIKRAPTTPVICCDCGRELRGTECADGFRVRQHRATLTGKRCMGAYQVCHQPVVVFRKDRIELVGHLPNGAPVYSSTSIAGNVRDAIEEVSS